MCRLILDWVAEDGERWAEWSRSVVSPRVLSLLSSAADMHVVQKVQLKPAYAMPQHEHPMWYEVKDNPMTFDIPLPSLTITYEKKGLVSVKGWGSVYLVLPA